MKKFAFRYEPILKLRQEAEENLKQELAELIHQLDLIENAREELNDRIHLYEQSVADMLKRGTHAYELHQLRHTKQYFSEQKQELQERLIRKKKEIEAHHMKLYEAIKERKIMEKLKEKAFRQYIDEYNQAEDKIIEEIVNYNNTMRQRNK